MSTLALFPGFSSSRYTEDDFRRDVESYGFLAMRRLAERTYREAPAEVRRTFGEWPEISRMIGQTRHSMMEQECRALGRRGDVPFLSSTDEQLRSRQGCIKPGSYVSMRYGDVIVTQSHTDMPQQLPPEALFRKNKARMNQWTLEESVDGQGPQRYIVFTHGPSAYDPEELGFMQAGFLHPSGRSYMYQYDLSELPVAKIMGLPQNADDIQIEIEIIGEESEVGGGE